MIVQFSEIEPLLVLGAIDLMHHTHTNSFHGKVKIALSILRNMVAKQIQKFCIVNMSKLIIQVYIW
jgi:hypothetical protein